ncbi:MAG: Na+/H+ antiporter NhaA, partial [Chloroflexi bacterium]|nr:Na+/H+ antiporter NhaA [Chloroflexota bacterium]
MTSMQQEHALDAQRAARQSRIIRLVRPVREFMRIEASSGVIIVLALVAAMIAANSPLSDEYLDLIHQEFVVDLGFFHLEAGVNEWVNDALMVIFFFVVGMEIKREVVAGELSGGSKVWTPIAAAAGGIIVPVAIFFAIVGGSGDAAAGWAVPMATDIAIAVGVVALVGAKVPAGLKVMLLAIAIVDDIGAIAVIAIFYTDQLSINAIALTFGLLALILAMNFWGVRSIPLYVAVGIFAWMTTHESGIHPTILGVALGIMTPMQPWYRSSALPDIAQNLLGRVRASESAPTPEHEREERVGALLTLAEISVEAVSPLDRLEHALLPWSAFVIVPIFAFVNAGVDLRGGALEEAATSSLTYGVGIGLRSGKPIGIT